MKLQIDTVAKTVKLEQSAKVSELLDAIQKLLPKDWKEYTLECVTVINNWNNPIYIDRWHHYPYWQNPFYISSGGTYTSNGSNLLGGGLTSNGATSFNLEITN